MDAKFLLLSLMALSSFHVIVNANPVNLEIYDLDYEFNVTLNDFTTKLNQAVEVALQDLINAQEQVILIAIGEIQLYNEELSKNAEAVLEEIEKISNNNCKNTAKHSLAALKDNLTESAGNCFVNHVELSNKLAEEGQKQLEEYLNVPTNFQNEFIACEDEECKISVLQKLVDETKVAEQKVQETTLEVVNNITQLIITFNENCLLNNLNEFEGASEIIVEEAEQCAEK